MKIKLSLITKSVMAGILIAMGGLALLLQSPLYFGFALLAICLSNLTLYTGRIGFVNKKNWHELPIILLFNVIGVILAVFAFRFLPNYEAALVKAEEIAALKMSTSYIGTFVAAMFCGIILYYACAIYKQVRGVEWFIWFAVTLFVVCGFNHVVADLFYFLMAGVLPLKHLGVILLGNSIGSIIANKMTEQ